jgi:hypothetical protein
LEPISNHWAQQQKMNTDVRRAIFCILMTSEDYLDAFEKLMKLQLKNKQDREIVSVVLHCVQQENKFNPFYAHLARQLCSFHKNNGVRPSYASNHLPAADRLFVQDYFEVCAVGQAEADRRTPC